MFRFASAASYDKSGNQTFEVGCAKVSYAGLSSLSLRATQLALPAEAV